MAGDRGVSFPIAALSVVALFLSTTFLGQHAYDLMRLGESDADKRLQRSQPPVEARLWEDPFSALNRYRAKLKELCDVQPGTNGTKRAVQSCARGELEGEAFRTELTADAKSLTVIAVMMPGANFIGVEEARRRVRYAVLAELNAEGFVPDDSEHMGLLYVQPCQKFADCGQPPRLDILYETLSERADTAGQGQQPKPPGAAREQRRVAVLWIDDTAVAPRWLSALAILLTKVVPDEARLRIIGPFKSDDLVSALVDDLPALAGEKARNPALFEERLAALARLRLINPFSTAPIGQLRRVTARLQPLPGCENEKESETLQVGETLSEAVTDCVADAFRQQLELLGVLAGPPPPFYVRTIGTDNTLIRLLVDELCGRGLAEKVGGRVILLSEWDSIYARSFARALKHRLVCPKRHQAEKDHQFDLENYPYLRGLDGANTDGAARQVRLVPRGDKPKDDKEPSIEWPESRDQRDYVRRLVEQLKLEEDQGGPGQQVRAIGVIGTDVNDKLLLVQALRAAFADRVLFTTDIDARLLHPDAVRYTRNLVVASSLPLVPDDEVVFDDHCKANNKVAPFRDVYQTAAFLGARYASADDRCAEKFLDAIEGQLKNPRLYEIGRDSAVELGTTGRPTPERARRIGYAVLTGVLLLGLGGFMLGRPAPVMRAALPWNRGAAAPFDLSTVVVAGLEVGAWGFALGVVIELGLPGSMGAGRVWLLALAFMLSFWALVYPGVRFPPAGRADVPLWLLMIVPPVCLVWLWLVPVAGDMREPFAPASGVSAWPSQLLRTLGVVLFAWFLDYAWGRSAETARRIGDDYFPVEISTARRSARPRRPLAESSGRRTGRGFDLVLAAPGRA